MKLSTRIIWGGHLCASASLAWFTPAYLTGLASAWVTVASFSIVAVICWRRGYLLKENGK